MPKTRNKKPPASRGSNASRQDGATTRQHILEVAGQVFAERGYADATSKEICQRAGANVAAVNYHFGSKEELYYAVLVEAHRGLGTIEDFTLLAELKVDPRAKLEVMIGGGLNDVVAENRKPSWQLKIMTRELVTSSPLLDRLEQNEALPKMKILRGVFAQIMQLPMDHPAVTQGFFIAMAPSILLLLGYQVLTQRVFPDLDVDPERLRKDMLTFAVAGLEALAKQAGADSKGSKTRAKKA